MNRVGPRTDPWGTDEVIGAQLDEKLPRHILCFRFDKNALIIDQ